MEEISNRFDNLRVPVSANEREKGTTPYYGANGIQDYVKGFTHNGEYVLIAEDGANDLKNYPVKYVNGLFWANNHVHVVQGKEGICDNKYLKYCFTKTNIESLLVGGGRAKLNANIMMSIDLTVPSFNEQVELGRMFYELDNLITLHQRKFNYILSHKLEIKLFFFKITKNVWEQRELFDVADYRNGKAHENDIDDDGKYIVINSKFVSTEGKIKKYSNKQNEPLLQNEIAFVLSDVPNGRAIAKTFLVDKSSKYTLNQRIAGITPHSNINPKFLSITLNRNKYFLQFDDGVKQTNLSLNDMKKFEELYPKKQEQDKIGELFTNLDNLITLHQRKCTYIFYSWEQRKLEEIVDFYRGHGLSWNDISEDGVNKCVLYGNLYTDYGMVINEVLRATNCNKLDCFLSEVGDVLIPSSDTTPTGLARASSLNLEGIILGGDINVLRPKTVNGTFLSYLINNNKNELIKRIKGTTVRHLNNSDIKDMNLYISSNLNEQVKIADILSNLDNLITLHQHKELKRRNDNNDNLRW